MTYPENIDIFHEKLNKKEDGSVYVIEEQLQLKNGKYEGILTHDNINSNTIRVFTGSKLTGEEILNYIISVPEGKPWSRLIKIFAEKQTVYVTYETQGDMVEAEDVNLIQDSLVATQKEIERYKHKNDGIVTGLDNRLKTAELNKAEKTYVDTQLLLKANKSSTYTKEETDQRIQLVVDAAPEALNTLKEIADALNNDPSFAVTMTNQLSNKVDKITGKQLSTEDYTTTEKNKLAGIEPGANKYTHPTTHPPSIITQDINNRFVTDAEKASWNAKSNLTLGETSTTAYRGDNGKVAYNHSQVAHAPSNAQKNSDITKAEIEAKLTGDITTHTHSQYATKADLGSAGYGDMLKSVYDTNNDGIVDTADSVPWGGITGKPSTFNPSTHKHSKSEITDFPASLPANGGNADTVDGHTVNSDVPSGAKFTDTITTINGKTGIIVKTDIVALGIPAQDTIYTHPSTHPASMIIQDANKRFVSDAEKTSWNDAFNKRHEHSNKTTLDKITQALLDAWDSAVNHILDSVKHITAAERTTWNSKANATHTHDDRYYTETEANSKFATKADLGHAGYGDMLKSIYDTNNDGIVDTADSVPWSGITGKPSTFNPNSHSHTIREISGLQTELDGKMKKGPLTWNNLKGV